MGKEQDAPPAELRRWTRIDDYLAGLVRRRSARLDHWPAMRTQPEEPRFTLDTLPFMLLMAGLLLMSGGVIFLALPPAETVKTPVAAEREQGVAPRGWFQEAQRDFHH